MSSLSWAVARIQYRFTTVYTATHPLFKRTNCNGMSVYYLEHSEHNFFYRTFFTFSHFSCDAFQRSFRLPVVLNFSVHIVS